MHQTGTNREFW